MGLLSDFIGGDVGQAVGSLFGESGVQGFVNTATLGISNTILDATKGPDTSTQIRQQQAQMQEELLRRSRQANLKDLQASQLAARTFEQTSAPKLAISSPAAPDTLTNNSFIGGI